MMNSKTQKLNNLFINYIGQGREVLTLDFGPPDSPPDQDMWTYSRRKYLIWREETVFFMKNNRVANVAVTEYIFQKAVRISFFRTGVQPEFKILRLFKIEMMRYQHFKGKTR